MNSLTVGTITFKSKKACKEYTRALLNNILIENPNKQVKVEGENFSYLSELIKRHPEYPTKVGSAVKNIFVSIGLGGGPFVKFVTQNGTCDSISWNKCCDSRPQTEYSKRVDSYRREVVPDILDFKHGVPLACVKCLSNSNLQVDHCGDHEFKDIVARYETCFQEVKSEGFRSFHKKLAQYQLLCDSCHKMK